MDTPEDVAKVLDEQATALREKLEDLTEALRELTALRTEVMQMKTVDFKKYADIIVNLQMKNDFYWLIKHFDEPMLDHIRSQFDQRSGTDFLQTFLTLQDRAIALGRSGVAPDSAEGLAFAQAYWDMILTFTGVTCPCCLSSSNWARQRGWTPSGGKRKPRPMRLSVPPWMPTFPRMALRPFQRRESHEPRH